MKNLKMCSFRLEESVFSDFKDFCTRNNITIKDSLTKVIEIILQANGRENDHTEDVLDVQTP